MTRPTDRTAAILLAGRERTGLTLPALARSIGVKASYMWGVEVGKYVASPAIAERLADRLGLDDAERHEVVGLARAHAGLPAVDATHPAGDHVKRPAGGMASKSPAGCPLVTPRVEKISPRGPKGAKNRVERGS